MTRINAGVPPEELSDQHLVAEWRELPRVRHLAERGVTDIPAEFTLGNGHMKFFANKGFYLCVRHRWLMAEMRMRGFSPSRGLLLSPEVWPEHLRGPYAPTPAAIAAVRERIRQRLPERARWTLRQPPPWLAIAGAEDRVAPCRE